MKNGFVLPPLCTDNLLAELTGSVSDMAKALDLTAGRDVVLQAGGNIGIWPRWLADHFGWVYTFEPEPANFSALVANVPQQNVFKLNAALGYDRHGIDLAFNTVNIGGHVVKGDGPIPSLRIDDLALPICDLIVLDVEGCEYPALRGAVETLARCKPVIMLEDRGHGERFGMGSFADITQMLADHGYREEARSGWDAIFVA